MLFRSVRSVPGLEGLVILESLVLGLAGVHAARHFRQRADLIWGAVTISGVGIACGAIIGLFPLEGGAYPMAAYQVVFGLQAVIVLVGLIAYAGSRESNADRA